MLQDVVVRGHCAAGLATLDLYRDEDLFARALKLEPVFEEAVHGLKSAARVGDIRNIGLAAGIDIEPDPKAPGLRGYDAMRRAFAEEDMVMHVMVDGMGVHRTVSDIGGFGWRYNDFPGEYYHMAPRFSGGGCRLRLTGCASFAVIARKGVLRSPREATCPSIASRFFCEDANHVILHHHFP